MSISGKHFYTVIITATDGNAADDDTITVTIEVTNVEEEPMFSSERTTREVAENTEAGENIGDPVTATDSDGDDLTYSLDDTGEASFDIVATTGQLRTQAPLNYEDRKSYAVTVTVTDNNPNDNAPDDTIVVDITVTPGGDPPAFLNASDVVITSTTRAVDENTLTDQPFGDPVKATDPDEDDLTYRLDSGGDNDSFDIVRATGRLKTKGALDHEDKPTYQVKVIASDGDRDTDDATIDVDITVNDVNEKPTFTPITESLKVEEHIGADQMKMSVIRWKR